MQNKQFLKKREKKRTSLSERIEAELRAVYDGMRADNTLTTHVFEKKLTPDRRGIDHADTRYGTSVGRLYALIETHPDMTNVSRTKILHRWIVMRRVIMSGLGNEKVESREFGDGALNEMPAWKDEDRVIGKYMGKRSRADIDSRYRALRRDVIEEFAIGDFLTAVVYSNHKRNTFNVHVFDGDTEVASFDWYKEGDKPWTILSAIVADRYQGKGIAYTVYTHMINTYIHTLMSDETLTGQSGKGAFDLWVKLGKTYPYRYVYNTTHHTYHPVKAFTRDMMGDEHVRFIVSQTEL